MTVTVSENNITLAVRDLVMVNPDRANMLSAFSLPQRGILGQEAQHRLQDKVQRSGGIFQKEVTVHAQLHWSGYTFTIRGRIDGVFDFKNRIEIEEIKTVILPAGDFRKIHAEAYPEYTEQVLIYCYLMYQQDPEREIRPFLTVINLLNDKVRTFSINFSVLAVEQLIYQRFQIIIDSMIYRKKNQDEKRSSLERIDFGLKEKRPQQQNMMHFIKDVLHNDSHAIISAPTGTGKTAAALVSALHYAMANGKKLFYATAKNTQHEIVLKTLKPLTTSDTVIPVIFLRAVEKMCVNDVFICHEDYCPFARDYHRRVRESGIFEDLLDLRIIMPDAIIFCSKDKKLCPAEVMLDLTTQCDIIVGDYNYVFDPVSFLRRLFHQKDYKDWLLIIDEAHNLYQRGLNYYSPALALQDIKKVQADIRGKKTKIYIDLAHILDEITQTIAAILDEAAAWYEGQQFCEIELDLSRLQKLFNRYESVFITYSIHKVNKKIVRLDDPAENLYFKFRRFVVVAQRDPAIYRPYLEAGNGGTLHIQCCDAAPALGSRIDGFSSVVAMSATMDPVDYYTEVLGFRRDATKTLQLQSPFPAEHRKLLIIPDVSTQFRHRQESYPVYAEIIQNIVAERKGNYLAFFPSYEFMHNVNVFLGMLPGERLIQRNNMSDSDRSDYIDALKKPGGQTTLLAVLGGIFSEGVDYSGDMCIGVIIFSPGLPRINYARELIRDYYDKISGRGFDYAYLYPGINKVIQAAGRLIRSYQDKGIIVLVGERFAQEQISHVLPDYWFSSPDSLVITDTYQQEIKSFWELLDRK